MNETLVAPPRYFCYSVDYKLRDKNSLRTWDVSTQQPESLENYNDYIDYFDDLFAEQIAERNSGDEVREFLAYHLNYFMDSVGGEREDFVIHLNKSVVPRIQKFKSEQARQALLVWLFLNKT